MRRYGLRVSTMLGVLLLLAAAPAGAQTCVLGSSYLMDGSATFSGREYGGFHRIYRWNSWSYGGKRFLIGSTYVGGLVWDVTNPSQPVELPNWSPWAGLTYPSTDDDSLQWDFATLDGHPYGIAMHGPMGWVAFQINNPGTPAGITRVAGSGVQFPAAESQGPKYARLFEAGGQIYAVGAWLNRQGPDVVVATFGNPQSMQVVSSLGALNSRIDLAAPFEIAVIQGTPYLIGFTRWVFGAQDIFVVNLANPAAPIMGGLSAPERIADIHVDVEQGRLFLISSTRLYVYSLANPMAPTQVSVQTLPASLSFGPQVSAHGDLAVALNGSRSSIPFAWGYSTDSTPLQQIFANDLGFPVAKWDEDNFDLSVLPASGGHFALFRAAWSVATLTLIDGGCVTTEPRPEVTVTGGTGGLACGVATAPSEGIAARGFPGDSFTLTNASSGQVFNPRVKIDRVTPSAPVNVLPEQPFTAPVAWNPPGDAPPGEYHVTVTVQDVTGLPYTKVRSIFLCADPTATLKVDGVACGQSCSVLVNTTVTLDAAASQGHPTGYTWIGAGDVWFSSTPTSPMLVATQGANPAGVIVQHGFQAPPHPSCDDPLFDDPLGGINTYATCAKVTITADFATLTFNVEQPSGTVKAAGPGGSGTVQVTQNIVLRYTGQVASGYERRLTWQVPGFSGCQDGASPCTIPANTLSPSDVFQTWSLTVDVRPVGGGEWAPVGTVSAQVRPTLAVDRTLTVTLGGAGSGTVTSQPAGINCPGTCSAPFTEGTAVTLIAVAGSGSVFGAWSGDGSECGLGYRCVTMSANRSVGATFNVAQVGTPPSAPALLSPANGATVAAGSVAFSWSASSAGTPPITYEVRVTSGGLSAGSCQSSGTSCSVTLPNGSYSWNVMASNQYGSATSTSRTLTVGSGGGTPPSAPALVSPTDGATVPAGAVNFSWNASGSGSTPITYTARVTVMGMNLGSCQSTGTSCSISLTEGTYSWNVQAANQFGEATSTSRNLTVGSACQEPNPPVANFDWTPKGTLMFNGVPQAQPFVGQPVQFQDLSSNNPTSWEWLDFGDGSPPSNLRNPTKVWQHAGTKNVRMRATNCAGTSQTVTKEVVIHADQRAVTADFTWTPAAPQTGTPMVFTAKTGFNFGDPTEFLWDFGDGGAGDIGVSVVRVFQCRGKYQVKLTSKRGSFTGTVTKSIDVEGDVCGPESVVAADAAKVAGYNNSLWRTDFRIFNPADEPTSIWLAVLPEGRDNRNPFQMGPYELLPRATLVLNNILGVFEQAGVNYSKAAIRITFENQSNLAPVVVARTYTDSPGGGTFGQFVPGNPVVAQSTTSPLWLTGLQSDGLQEGFRTNFGLANLRGDASGAPGVKATIYDAQGVEVATKTFNLAPYGYVQHAVHNIFGDPALQTLGTYSMKIDVPAGLDVAPYASVVDNSTNDPVLIPALPAATSPVFLAAVARNPGALGTVWRTDFQITNPDRTATRHWEVTFLPKGQLPTVSKQISLAAGKTQRIADAVAWIYDPLPAPEAQGMLRFRPLDGSGVYPAVAGRTYNVTATGTFGQNIPAMHAGMGAAKGGPVEWLVLPGMSTEDIARSNIGFVNLSADKVVDFEVYFFDELGDLLNPDGEAYTFALNFGGWDQDKLENRFRNRFGQDLPANLRAVTALIRVRNGGPGTAYASVIDSLTGDPVFIPAQQLP